MEFKLKLVNKYLVLSEAIQAAGGIFYAQDTGRICVARRSGLVGDPYTWATWGGKVDKNEKPEATVRREILEEAGYSGGSTLKHVYTDNYTTKTNPPTELIYETYLVIIDEEFEPKLNWENIDYRW